MVRFRMIPEGRMQLIRKHLWSSIVGMSLGMMALPACSSTASSPTGGSSATTPTRDDAMRVLSAVLLDMTATLYNENLVGHSSGAVNTSSACPVSGSVDITGTLSINKLAAGSASTSSDLTLHMSNCGATTPNGELTGDTGTSNALTYKGSWVNDSTGAVTQETLTLAGTAALSGSVIVQSQSVAVDEPTCQLSITYVEDNGSWTVSGVVCGVSVHYAGTK